MANGHPIPKPVGAPASTSHPPSSAAHPAGGHAGQSTGTAAGHHEGGSSQAAFNHGGPTTHKGEPAHEAQSQSQAQSGHEAPQHDTKQIPESSPEGQAGSQGARAILSARPFILKAFRHDEAEGTGKVTGGVLSQTLDKMGGSKGHIDAETLSMAALRKLMPGMSRYPKIDKFCTPSGTLIDDETVSIVTYLELEGEEDSGSSSSGAPSVKIYFRATKLGSMAGKGADGAEGSSVQAFNLADRPKLEMREQQYAELLEKPEAKESLINSDDYSVSMEEPGKGAGMLDETEWTLVLRNCAVFYGWIFDPCSNKIVRAPKPAFQLRSKVDQEPVAMIPDFVSEPEKADGDKDVASNGDAKGNLPTSDNGEQAGEKESEDEDGQKNRGNSKKKEEEEPVEITPRSEHGIPNFIVNDDSRVEITAHSSEMSVSMARSDFSESSTEASISGGGWGVSASASYASSSNSESESQGQAIAKSQTIVARYMFPRCDLVLWPDELEPTEELAKLLALIRKTRNIKALRRVHAEYGNLFCQRVTLGGRLLSTKLVSVTSQEEVSKAKESFRTSVGASISGSYGGFSGKAEGSHDKGGGTASTNSSSSSSQNESCVFEAVGGSTILATNPQDWSPTVANHELWRVINREALSPLAEILSGIPGYEAVQSWFVRAVPAMSRYMSLDQGHACKVRLRVTAPSNGLMIDNTPTNNASFYLGHDPGSFVTPRQIAANTLTPADFWIRVEVTQEIPIFNPATWRAPAIFGYSQFKVGDSLYGSKYNAEFTKTAWDIIAPFDEQLKDGTRVILRSAPFIDPAAVAEQKINPSHMVVFRNAQGEFLPGMSDSDEYQYWRLIKSDKSTRYIKPGDDVRLCWGFADQTTGWRDYVNDVFGRRQVVTPPEVPDGRLFLKVPWPRFEVSGVPTAMIMSSDPVDLTSKVVNVGNEATQPQIRYCLQDLHLRIDGVTNKGRGDVDDCMLNKVKQEETKTLVNVEIKGFPMQMRRESLTFGC